MKIAVGLLVAFAAAGSAGPAQDKAPFPVSPAVVTPPVAGHPPSDATFRCPPDIARQLAGEWTENPAGSATLHRGGPKPEWGAARFRRHLWFGADGVGGWLHLAPDDAHYVVEARYAVDANCRISMQATQPPKWETQGRTYQTTIVAFDGATLRIQGGYP